MEHLLTGSRWKPTRPRKRSRRNGLWTVSQPSRLRVSHCPSPIFEQDLLISGVPLSVKWRLRFLARRILDIGAGSTISFPLIYCAAHGITPKDCTRTLADRKTTTNPNGHPRSPPRSSHTNTSKNSPPSSPTPNGTPTTRASRTCPTSPLRPSCLVYSTELSSILNLKDAQTPKLSGWAS